MGTFHVGCRILNQADRKKSAVVRNLMVYTGSEYTWVGEETLKAIGIKPEKQIRLILANGSELKRDVGFAVVQFDKWFTVDEVVFALKGDMLLLGARTLEGLNLRVDPQRKELIESGPSPAAPIVGQDDIDTEFSPAVLAQFKRQKAVKQRH